MSAKCLHEKRLAWSHINNLTMHLKALKNKNKQLCKRKERNKQTQGEINETKTTKDQQYKESKSQELKRLTGLTMLIRLTKRKREII